MKPFTVLLAVLVTATSVSTAPSHIHKLLERFGIRGNFADYVIPSNASKEDPGKLQLGYAEFISSSGTTQFPIAAWPFRQGIWDTGKGHLRRIPYCFVNKRSSEKIGGTCKIESAVQLWADALGGKASRATQHSLVIQGPQHPEDYCCTHYTYGIENAPLANGDLQCVWNTAKYPKDALAIHRLDEYKLDGKGAVATLGYTAEEHDSDAGRHYIYISDVEPVASLAHELGHVFGMVHEHQRWDRDDHVEFRCDNLLGIMDAVDLLQTDAFVDEHTALDMLCSDYELALKYHSPSADYVKGNGLDPHTRPTLDGQSGFDADSIMMYPSMMNSHENEEYANVHDAVLVRTAHDGLGRKVPATDWRILPPTKVSEKDAAFVRRFYAWDEARAAREKEKEKEKEKREVVVVRRLDSGGGEGV
ncbi:hypothetical protein ACN47E_009486 [Coniothyrium glycines]